MRRVGLWSLSIRSALRQFCNDAHGSMATIFGVMIFVLFGMIGLAVDFAVLVNTNGKIQSSADSAALSAATAGLYVAKDLGTIGESAIEQIQARAEEAAKAYFHENAREEWQKISSFQVETTVNNGKVDVLVKYSGSQPTLIANILGVRSMSLGGVANSVASVQPYVDVYLLVDTSGSMAFGASPSDQSALVAATGCAFACHDGAPVNGYADAYSFATANGITLRHGALNSGISALMNNIDEMDPGHAFVRTAVYSFDNTLTLNTGLTGDTSQVRSRLPSSPAISNETEGATRFKEIIGKVVADVGSGGDGSSPDKAIKLLIIATDGAQDPGRYWTSNIAARAEVDAFDMSFCEPLKSDGVNVGIIHTPYQPIPSDWGYLATLGQPSQRGGPGARVDDIAPALKKCGQDRYVLANDTKSIQSAFTKIFKTLAGVYLAK